MTPKSTENDDITQKGKNNVLEQQKQQIYDTDKLGVPQSDYEFLDCGNLRRLERFGGTSQTLYNNNII